MKILFGVVAVEGEEQVVSIERKTVAFILDELNKEVWYSLNFTLFSQHVRVSAKPRMSSGKSSMRRWV